jgi:hypothetical protein
MLLEVQNTYSICGNGAYETFDVPVECMKLRFLRYTVRDLWQLPKEEKFVKIGEDWLLILLDNTNKDMH